MSKILLRRPRLSTRTPLIIFTKKSSIETDVKESSISGGKSSKRDYADSMKSEVEDKKQDRPLSKCMPSDTNTSDRAQSSLSIKTHSHHSDSDWDDKIQNAQMHRPHPSLASDSEISDEIQYLPITIKEAKLELEKGLFYYNKKGRREMSSHNSRYYKQFLSRSHRFFAKKSTLAKLHEEESEIVENNAPGLNALILQTSKMSQIPVEKAQSVVYSRKTYTEITQLLAEKFMSNSLSQDKFNIIRIPTENLGEYRRRIPQRQLIIEIAAILKEHIKETMNINVHTVIQSVPKYQFGSKGKPSTEIVLYRQPKSDTKYVDLLLCFSFFIFVSVFLDWPRRAEQRRDATR